jgi:hypothetical protein
MGWYADHTNETPPVFHFAAVVIAKLARDHQTIALIDANG